MKIASNDVIICALKLKRKRPMRTTLALDDQLMSQAQLFTGLNEKSALVREALRALIERESAKRLVLLGGSQPQLEMPPRRQTTAIAKADSKP
jgi:Arc/MetJ family transcription regulator